MNNEKYQRSLAKRLRDEEDENSEEECETTIKNRFANDGSFLEMCRKMEEEKESRLKADANRNSNDGLSNGLETKSANETTSVASVAKRRSKVLKIGVIKRNRQFEESDDAKAVDAWQQYMNEVRKYKDKFGDDSDKNRPLVK